MAEQMITRAGTPIVLFKHKILVPQSSLTCLFSQSAQGDALFSCLSRGKSRPQRLRAHVVRHLSSLRTKSDRCSYTNDPMGKGSVKAKQRRKKKLKARKPDAAASAAMAGGAAAAAASEYLEQWAVRKEPNATWKFSKSRQTFLLKGWPHSHRVSRDSFKHLLNYLQTLPEGTATKTIEQAKQVATSAEKDELALEARVAARKELAADADAADEEDDEDNETGGGGGAAQDGGIAALEEQRAMLKIQRARALRVLNALVAAKSSQEFEQ